MMNTKVMLYIDIIERGKGIKLIFFLFCVPVFTFTKLTSITNVTVKNFILTISYICNLAQNVVPAYFLVALWWAY